MEVNEPTTFESSIIRARPNRGKADSLFLYCLFNSPRGRYLLGTILRQVAVSGITGSDLVRLQVSLPPLPTQTAIAHILGTLDDKIELNRRTNETLEAIARAVFKSWFVDFDPVRAKMDGQKPVGMDEETARLFPDSFDNSSLGKIPHGWQVGTLLSYADLLSGGTPKTSMPEYWGGSIPWASAKDVSQCGECFLIATERTITPAGLNNSATRVIEPYSTVVVARGATTGRMAMFGLPIAMNQTCYAVRSNIDCHLFQYTMTRNAMGSLVHSAHGSVFDTITTRTFYTSAVLVSPASLARAFERSVEPLFFQILSRQKESLTLTAIRDTLLPKLLSGKFALAMLKNLSRR